MSQGIFDPLSIVALESIDFQVKDKCVKRLEIIFDDIHQQIVEKHTLTERDIKAFCDLIQAELRARFKMKNLVFVIHESPSLNAYAIPPDITKSSIMYKTYYGMGNQAGDGKLLLDKVNSAVGTVNSKDATVGGIFTEVKATCAITSGVLLTTDMASLEKIALIMHEMGHIFTYLETLSYTFGTCFILTDTMARLNKAKSQEEKVKIYRNVEKQTGLEVKDIDILVNNEDESLSMVSIFKTLIDGTRSEYGSSIYDMCSFESLSDQFAARMGLTVHLAKALDTILRDSMDGDSFTGDFSIWIMNIVRWVAVIVSAVVMPVLGGILIFLELLVLMISPFERVYDKPGERIKRLRNEVVFQMKESTLSPAHRETLKQDLDFIDGILEHIEDKENYVEKVWLFFSANSRDQKEKRLLLQDLQELTNNNLFASANILKTLKG